MIKYLLSFSFFILCSLGNTQNLIKNFDFSEGGGSLQNWETNSKTTYEFSGGEHLAFLNTDATLYQRVEGVLPGKIYEVTLNIKSIVIKQTTGYGYAVEFGSPLVIPDLTLGSTPLGNFCNGNSGLWTNFDAGFTSGLIKYNILVPEGATAIYVCVGSKGALANIRIRNVSLELLPDREITFRIESNKTGEGLKDAEIYFQSNETTLNTSDNGTVTTNLITSTENINVIVSCDYFQQKSLEIPISDTTTTIVIGLDDIIEIKKVVTRISKYGDNATPYPLFGHLWNSGLAYNNTEIELITSAFDYIVGGGGLASSASTNDKLHAAASEFQVISYSGGWDAGFSTIANNKMELLYYRCGTIAQSISDSQTTFAVNAPPSSKGKGIIASKSGVFDLWIRVENELMKVISVSSSTSYPITVTVERGYSQTIPVAHSSGKTVTQPLYAGNGAPVETQTTSSQEYFIPVDGFRKYKLEDAISNNILVNKHDGIWIDILVGRLGALSLMNNGYDEWDHSSESLSTDAKIIKSTKDALNYMYEKFYARNGFYPVIYGNNVLYPTTLDESGRAWVMVKNSTHPRGLDGFCHENSWGHMTDEAGTVDNDGVPVPTENIYKTVGKNGHYLQWYMGDSWINNCKSIAFLAQNNLPNQPMTINAGFKNQWFASDLTTETRYDFNKYAYASYLMSVKVASDSSITSRMGISPMVDNGTVSVEVQTFFYYDLGIPLQNYNYSSFTNYRYSGSVNLYSRKFSKGIVLLNPFKDDMPNAISISAITGTTTKYYDPENNDEVVSSIQLKSREAKLLLMSEEVKIKNELYNDLNIYPTPAGDYLYIDNPGFAQNTNILSGNIYDLNGKVVETITIYPLQTNSINISKLNPGIYLFRIFGFNSVYKIQKR